jgi:hypothetical protein
MTTERKDVVPKFIRRIMPNATDAQLREATDNFKQYMAIALRIYMRTKDKISPADSLESLQ